MLLRLKISPQYLLVPGDEYKLPDFPANSSLQTKAELKYLHDWETKRTPELIARCKELADVYYNVNTKPGDADYNRMQLNLFYMARQIPFANAEKLPLTAQMMRRVWSDATYYFWFHKFRFNRTRPYMLDKSLKPIDTGTNFMAYPSGHASASYMAAYIYAELFPESKKVFIENAFEMAHSREILGLHFPSDSEAGRIFARQFVNILFQNPAFKKDFMDAKKEILAVESTNNKP